MFLSKVHDQKVELIRALFKNLYLKEKSDYLDSECKMLAEHILTSQVTQATKTDLKTVLENDLDKLRFLTEQKTQELAAANEKLLSLSINFEQTNSSVFNSLSETKSMNEDLNFKNEVIKCLQEELVQVRLEVAEKWALIRELKQIKDEMEKEKDLLMKNKPETISRLQEEIMQNKLLETQYALDFDQIKKHLQFMKSEIAKHKESEQCANRQSDTNIKLSLKSVFWKNENSKNTIEINEILSDIKKLEAEKSYLQSKIPNLKNKLEILNKHIEYKESEKNRLQEKIDNLKLKYQSTENITQERKRQYEQLKNQACEKVGVIRGSCLEKRQDIDVLSNKLDTISQRRQSYSTICKLRETNTVESLEEQIEILQNRIRQLQNENAKFSMNCTNVTNGCK